MIENKDNPEVELPDAGDFDLISFIDETHTNPTYTTTVHLDKDAVVKANRLGGEIDKLEADFKSLQEIAEKGSASTSLGSESDATKRYRAVGKELKAKKAERELILEKAKGSALKIVFQKPVSESDDEQDISAQIRMQLSEEFPDLVSGFTSSNRDTVQQTFMDNPALTTRQNVLMMHKVMGSITTAKGQTVVRGPKLTEEVVTRLVKRLDSSDNQRLQLNSNQAMLGADLMEEATDAGFLG